MTKKELYDEHYYTCKEAFDTLKAKNDDYSDGHDPFKNFRGSLLYDIHPVEGILLRIGDKMQRIHTFLKKGKLSVKSESVNDSIEDCINYLILAKCIIKEYADKENDNNKQKNTVVDVVEQDKPKPKSGRGRPKGSKNKSNVDADTDNDSTVETGIENSAFKDVLSKRV